MRPDQPKAQRCAIYTRVSTDSRLEQEFNSLDNQREACEAYVASQRHEGWQLVTARFDDGGFSGGSLDRPALQQLLTEIRDRQVDVVVVYKVDRLTRSLADFAKLVELFDANAVSFVSITQAFNTTTSMGRLTLNVLLSFAQFEREVTAERIRDKIAASKRKGLRMGGPVPLGYRVENKRLVIDEVEAEQVREIFRLYLELGALNPLLVELRQRGICTKRTVQSSGAVRGGIPFGRGALAYLLRNRVYVGEIVHKGQYYPGDHPAIVDPDVFQAVQDRLASNLRTFHADRVNGGSLLMGKLYDDNGFRMTPSSTIRGSRHYRYYISSALLQGRKEEAGSVPRVSAPIAEKTVLEALRKRELDGLAVAQQTDTGAGENLASQVDRVVVTSNQLQIWLHAHSDDEILITAPLECRSRMRKREILRPEGAVCDQARRMRSETRARLVEGMAKGRSWLEDLVAGRIEGTNELAKQAGCSERTIRSMLSLAFLDPQLTAASVAGTLPEGCGVAMLIDAPILWKDQSDFVEARQRLD